MLPPQGPSGVHHGLMTAEALRRLYKEVEEVLNEYSINSKTRRPWVVEALHHSSRHSRISWLSTLVLLVSAAIFLLAPVLNHRLEGDRCIQLQGLIVLVLLMVNLIFNLLDSKLRHEEMYKKAVKITAILKRCSEVCNWKADNYPHLCSPYSPCITLQWTYRDGRLVNLPWALLVGGDTVMIRPGQPAPGHCVPLDDKDCPELRRGEVYSPLPNGGGHEAFSTPMARLPLPSQAYVMKETPYLRNLRQALNEATLRPPTFHDRRRHLLVSNCVEQLALLAMWLVALLVNTLRYVYVSDWLSSGSMYEMLLLGPLTTVLPLLPLVLPCAWIALNSYGNARLIALQHIQESPKEECDPFDETDFEDTKTSWSSPSCLQVKQLFWDVLCGRDHSLARSANLLHVLGSVTALCCVDKKGILSWPNPTAEKVFFLRSAKEPTPNASDSGVEGGGVGGGGADMESHTNLLQPTPTHHKQHNNEAQTVAEVLDLTHDNACPFRLHFDDTSWNRHLKSLKPLGLAILLNTCNMDTQDHYTQFCSHVTCEALYNEDLVPVANRRSPCCAREMSTLMSTNKCLCELAKQIGFTDGAPKIFTLDQQLSTFRHVQPETVRRDIKFARTLALATKLKFPFPHMVAVVVKDKSNHNSLQLFSQGTADIVLDACVDFYDGKELHTLSSADRKKVQDFYQRTSLTAYCTAFAYRPLPEVASVSEQLTRVYLELPADAQHLYMPHRSPSPSAALGQGLLDHSLSADSLLASDSYEEHITDINNCFKIQCNQIFIGMVTMQYQALSEMVQLIDQLERACIRFVHFSKENELRSRVFSEKMGLESGWNCHISLLSERSSDTIKMAAPPPSSTDGDSRDDLHPLLANHGGTLSSSRAMSMSAPSAINMEHRSSDVNQLVTMEDDCPDLSHGDAWQSLSCLTDSTEQSAPVNFDMSNRAKLPRGIDKIRPHLELVDNVPLLVSLFTDCTVSTTREMIHIMQDYGETVCVMGSSANADNVGIFLQANASLAVEPLFPQVCQKVSVFQETTSQQGQSPVYLSNTLNSLPCCMQDASSIFLLIMEARHFMQCAWSSIQYWVCCLLTLTTVQLLAAMFLLPPIFTLGQVLWLSVVITPLLSLSLVAAKTDPQVMHRATGKNHTTLNTEMAVFVLWCYGVKFVITMVLAPVMFAGTLSLYCFQLQPEATTSQCGTLPPTVIQQCSQCNNTVAWGGWSEYPLHLQSARLAICGLVVLHFLVISISFVYRERLIWRRAPWKNVVWVFTFFLVLGLQSGFTLLSLQWHGYQYDTAETGWPEMPVVLVTLTSLPLVFLVNESVKWQEIKANERYQKRARLDFGTKLGMNSPF
ncbi:transmembrane protein 94 isoform X2 [Macrosteles quadrilineatus]|uniref:transmembrane protein 94 isoform X2 n=1 Tax=Macrosteles quadrilineatus TaxID=74068 RepID=UPI0023E0D383|nr:transmembrane protein 94 isoform X2 [Macrosteles quadrilineatus]